MKIRDKATGDIVYAADTDTYQMVKLTFDAKYTHVILWRNGVKKLVALDKLNSLTIENGAGEAAYIIPYTYKENPGYIWDSTQEDNGVWFPSEDTQEGIWS